MTTAQEDRQSSVRSVSGSSLTHNGDWHAMFDVLGIAQGTYNERLLSYISLKLGITYTNINDAMNALALNFGAVNFSSLGTFDAALYAPLLDSTVMDLDATIAASYSGSGQTWFNLKLAPADSSPASSYNVTLGSSTSPGTDDPTFVGTAGTPSAYWTNDGNDRFRLAAVNTTFLNSLHRSDRNQPFWMCYVGRMGDYATSTPAFYTNTASTTLGVRISITSGEQASLSQGDGTVSKTLNSPAAPVVPIGTDFIAIFSFDGSGQVRRWISTFTATQNSNTLNTATADASQRLDIFTSAPTDARLYAVSMGNAFLDNAGAEALMRAYFRRHQRGYGLFPENTVAPSISGTNRLGETLTTTDGTWLNSPTITYQWRRNGNPIAGATASTYVVQLADLGADITCAVTGTANSEAVTVASNTISIPNTLAGVVAGAVAEWDATMADSYSGSGQVWANRIADTAYDMNLGTSSSPATDDPTFIGTAGSPDAYWLNDGADRLQLASGTNTTFLDDLHKSTSTQPWTMICAFQSSDQSASVSLMTTASGTTALGLRMGLTSSESFFVNQQDGVTNNTLGTTYAAGIGIDRLGIVSFDPATNTVRHWLTSRTGASAVDPYLTATGAASLPLNLFRSVAAGSRFYAAALLNTAIATDTDAGKIFDYFNFRHNRTYA